MRRRLRAVLLAAGLCASVFSVNTFADEVQSEGVQQAIEEIASDEEADGAEGQTEALSQEEQLASQLGSMLSQISAWSDEQIETMIDGKDPSSAAIAANWKSVKNELGEFREVTDAQMDVTDEKVSITGHAKYDKLDDRTDVTVNYEMDTAAQTVTINWEVDYPFGILMERAALNTVMGLGIVFLTLLFLSWLIGKLHYIPEFIGRIGKPKETAPLPAAEAPAAAPAAAEEDLTDDLELVAVITAAIAASGTTSGDGFVVRSIKKSTNKRNWQRA